MMKPFLAVATAAAIFAGAPMFGGATPAKAEGVRVAQIDVEIGRDRGRDRDRDDRRDDRRDRRDRDISVGVRPGGIVVGPRRERCRTVTTTIIRDDGRRVRRTERRCS
jgi:hypothetical protein